MPRRVWGPGKEQSSASTPKDAAAPVVFEAFEVMRGQAYGALDNASTQPCVADSTGSLVWLQPKPRPPTSHHIALSRRKKQPARPLIGIGVAHPPSVRRKWISRTAQAVPSPLESCTRNHGPGLKASCVLRKEGFRRSTLRTQANVSCSTFIANAV